MYERLACAYLATPTTPAYSRWGLKETCGKMVQFVSKIFDWGFLSSAEVGLLLAAVGVDFSYVLLANLRDFETQMERKHHCWLWSHMTVRLTRSAREFQEAAFRRERSLVWHFFLG